MNAITFDPHQLCKIRECIKLIEFSILVGAKLATSHERCSRARNLLHDMLVSLEQNGGGDRPDVLYLAMFDALSHLTSALVSRPFGFTLIREALLILRSVRDSAVRA